MDNLPPWAHYEQGRFWLDLGITPPGTVVQNRAGQGMIYNAFPEYPDLVWYQDNTAIQSGFRGTRSDPIPPGAWTIGFKDESSHGGLRGGLSNMWDTMAPLIDAAMNVIGPWLLAFGIFGTEQAAGAVAGESAASAAASETAAETAASQLAAAEAANATGGFTMLDALEAGDYWAGNEELYFSPALDAAAATNAQPWYERLIEKAGDRLVNEGISSLFQSNVQPSTRAVAGPSPIANQVPVRGMESSMPYFSNASMDMKPFLIIAVVFAVMIALLSSFGRR